MEQKQFLLCEKCVQFLAIFEAVLRTHVGIWFQSCSTVRISVSKCLFIAAVQEAILSIHQSSNEGPFYRNRKHRVIFFSEFLSKI